MERTSKVAYTELPVAHRSTFDLCKYCHPVREISQFHVHSSRHFRYHMIACRTRFPGIWQNKHCKSSPRCRNTGSQIIASSFGHEQSFGHVSLSYHWPLTYFVLNLSQSSLPPVVLHGMHNCSTITPVIGVLARAEPLAHWA